MPTNRPTRSRIKAARWWNTAHTTFQNIIVESLRRAVIAEKAETGHECGHEWTIVVASRGHYGVGGSEEHSDADYSDTYEPVVVRAHDLRAALLLAAAKPLDAWFPEETEGDG